MRQPERTTLSGQTQRRILDAVFLLASESQKVPKCGEGVEVKKMPVGKKCRSKPERLRQKSPEKLK